MRAPPSIRRAHDNLHAELARAGQEPGRLGEAAREVARILHPHDLREDAFAHPPLSLLPRLARGQFTSDMADVLPVVVRLKEELPLMLQEHRAILVAVRDFAVVAHEQADNKYVRFAADLIVHVQFEEEVLYPAAMLVGEFVKGKLHVQPVSS